MTVIKFILGGAALISTISTVMAIMLWPLFVFGPDSIWPIIWVVGLLFVLGGLFAVIGEDP